MDEAAGCIRPWQMMQQPGTPAAGMLADRDTELPLSWQQQTQPTNRALTLSSAFTTTSSQAMRAAR